MTPLLPGLRGGLDAGTMNRGDVYWADPQFPTGRSDKVHRCVLLRSPRSHEVNVPVLTMHTLDRKPDAVNDCCMEFARGSYRGIKHETVIDARMTMFVPVAMLREYCFSLRPDDLDELEVCLVLALEIETG